MQALKLARLHAGKAVDNSDGILTFGAKGEFNGNFKRDEFENSALYEQVAESNAVSYMLKAQ